MTRVRITKSIGSRQTEVTEFETDEENVSALDVLLILTASKETQELAAVAAALNKVKFSEVGRLLVREHLGILEDND